MDVFLEQDQLELHLLFSQNFLNMFLCLCFCLLLLIATNYYFLFIFAILQVAAVFIG